MKRYSLQWRLTIICASLLTIICICLTLSINQAAFKQMDHIGNAILNIDQENQLPYTIELNQFIDEDQINKSKTTFFIQSTFFMCIIIILGSISVYLLSGKILKPIRELSNKMENIHARNLLQPIEISDTKDEIAKLSHSFNDMLARLDEAFSLQKRFSANAAHELRTPLTVIQTKLEIFQKQPHHSDEEVNQMIELCTRHIERLTHLVNQLLQMSELQTIRCTDEIDLDVLLEEITYDLADIAQQKQVEIILESEKIQMIGNDSFLYRAIYNLVENAIKYNHINGHVQIKAALLDQKVEIIIQDDGDGIPVEHQKHIFEPFYRVDKSRSRVSGGNGLGLALVKAIIDCHHGEISLESSQKKGSRFTIILPLH